MMPMGGLLPVHVAEQLVGRYYQRFLGDIPLHITCSASEDLDDRLVFGSLGQGIKGFEELTHFGGHGGLQSGGWTTIIESRPETGPNRR